MSPLIYLDNSQQSAPSQEAIHAAIPYLSNKFGQLTQPHQPSWQAWVEAHKEVQELFGSCSPGTVQVQPATSLVENVLWTLYEQISFVEGRTHFVASPLSAPPLIAALERLKKWGAAVQWLKVDKAGLVTKEALEACITPRTAACFLPWVHGVTGVVQPLEGIGALCQLRKVRLCLESTYGLLAFPLPTQVDYAWAFGAPLHAFPHSGFLWVKEGNPLPASFCDDLPTEIAASLAVRQVVEARPYLCMEIARLRYHFEHRLKQEVPGVTIIAEDQPRAPHISAVIFAGVSAEALAFLLYRDKVAVSLGGALVPTLESMLLNQGYAVEQAQSALSMVFSRHTADAEVDQAVERIKKASISLRAMSEGICKTSL